MHRSDRDPQVADAGSRAHDSDAVRLRVCGSCWWVPELRKTGAALKPDTSALAVAVPRAGELGKGGCRLEFGPTHSGCLPLGFREGGPRRRAQARRLQPSICSLQKA